MKLPVPHRPVCVTEAECGGYEFSEGEDTREPGERLAASYVNFYFGNDCVLVPQFGGEFAEDDARALEILRSCIRGREIVPVSARCILLGGGNIHCITQQIPKSGIQAEIRPLGESEIPCLREFLYDAIFIPEGAAPPDPAILDAPELQLYLEGFGSQPHDRALAAVFAGRVVGVVWTRIMHDYGHLYDGVPSLAIAVSAGFRGYGIGTELMRAMLNLLEAEGCEKLSLSVQKANRAAKLYRRLGFEAVGETDEEYQMLYRFGNGK